ncbi:MAG TPA: hypothetical protein VFZ99_02530 [Terriglobales bacterium]
MDIGKTLKTYLFWTQERGSMHYDVMVSLILAFIFIAPHYVNFNDKPAVRAPHPNQVIITPDRTSGFVYEVSASDVPSTQDDNILRAELAHVLQPAVGKVEILRYEAVRDSKGRVTAYRAWGQRP